VWVGPHQPVLYPYATLITVGSMVMVVVVVEMSQSCGVIVVKINGCGNNGGMSW